MSYYLPMDSINDANKILAQTRAVTDLMSYAETAEFAHDTFANLAWLLRDNLKEIHDIVNLKQ